MPFTKRLIICVACFLVILGLGLIWAGADTVELSSGLRLGMAVFFGLVVSAALFYILHLQAIVLETKQDEQGFHLARHEFSTQMGHEIRTPLSGILGVMHLLKRTQLDRNQQRYIDTASNSANMLLTIINDVLAPARSDTGWYRIESESIDLIEVIEDVTSILAPEAIARGLELVSDIDPNIPHRIRGDGLRLRQLLNNLLNNAIKFTDSGLVAIYATSSENGLEIGVKDTGVGIDAKRQELMLQPLEQIDSGSLQESGVLGLGLKTGRRLLEAMGSELKIESEPGCGSRFYFDLPVAADLSASYDWKPPQALQDLSIAILSPHELQRNSIRKMLAHWNINAIQEVDFDADQARDLPLLNPCDVVIVDQAESEQAVDDLIERMRNNSDWRESRFVHLVPQDRENEGGSADVRLHKPLSHSRLYTTMLDIVYKLAFYSEHDPRHGGVLNASRGILSGHRVLLVEDNDINKMIALEMLEETGVDVDVATNGKEAIEQVQQQPYELILMDIQMPVMDGYQATQAIRALGGEYASMPIIAMTAHALEGDSSKSLDSGMNYHISKPFEPDALIELMVRFIEQRSQ
jgi:two-component system sensor histidine kinase/response regulator